MYIDKTIDKINNITPYNLFTAHYYHFGFSLIVFVDEKQ